MKKYVIITGVIAVVVLTVLWAKNALLAGIPSGQACTQEAKLCADGSAVGRTGPNCEFALCPDGSATAATTNAPGVGMSTTINGTTIRVLGLVQDSRCPVGVQCIQAGTVRVRVAINSFSSDFTFTLGQPQVVGNATITLAGVTPARYATQTPLLNNYRFTFTVVSVARAKGASR